MKFTIEEAVGFTEKMKKVRLRRNIEFHPGNHKYLSKAETETVVLVTWSLGFN